MGLALDILAVEVPFAVMGLAPDVLAVEVPFAANALGVGEGLLVEGSLQVDGTETQATYLMTSMSLSSMLLGKLIRLNADGV